MRIVMTGATQGIGAVAAQVIADDPGNELIVGARNVSEALPGHRNVTVLPLDLADLDNVRTFCRNLPDDKPFDALVCNAGIQLSKPQFSEQGYELTFAVNHLAHFLILHLIEGNLASNARVIATSSGTHDPSEKTPVVPPDHADADLLAYPERDPNLPKRKRPRNMRAYSSSKLCNILMIRELARRRPELSTMAFDPGFVPGTGLMREHPKFLVGLLSKIIPFTMARDRTSDKGQSGAFLAELATASRYAGCRGEYWAVRDTGLECVQPSELACNMQAAQSLWDASIRLAMR